MDWSDARIGQMPSCLVLSLPLPHLHMIGFTDARNIHYTPLQNYGVAGEDVHLVFGKYVRFANLATFVDRISPTLTLASFLAMRMANESA